MIQTMQELNDEVARRLYLDGKTVPRTSIDLVTKTLAEVCAEPTMNQQRELPLEVLLRYGIMRVRRKAEG